MTVPAGIIIAWPGTAAAIPAGWARVASLDGRYVKGAGAGQEADQTGGALTHTHTSPTHTHTGGAHTHTGGSTGALVATTLGEAWNTAFISYNADTGHVHSFNGGTSTSGTSALNALAATWEASSSTPPYVTVIWIQSNGTPVGIPVGAWAFWADDPIPGGWSLPASASDKYLMGAVAAGNGGETGGGTSHGHSGVAHTHADTHTHTGNSMDWEGGTGTAQMEDGGANGSLATHTHNSLSFVSVNSPNSATSAAAGTTASVEPAYKKIAVIENASGGPELPTSVIGLWLGSIAGIPESWILCDGAGAAKIDMRGQHLKAATAASEIGDIGGSNTHDHTDPTTHTHSTAHTHNMLLSGNDGAATSYVDGTFDRAFAGLSHVHTVLTNSTGGASGSATQTVDVGNNEPPYRTVQFLQYVGGYTATNVTPAVDAVVDDPIITFEWDNTNGTHVFTAPQNDYQVLVYAFADSSGLALDTGRIASADEFHVSDYADWTVGHPLNNQTYYWRVVTYDSDGLSAVSPLTTFTTEWESPGLVVGLTVTPINYSGDGLPALHVEWSPPIESGDQNFVQTNVYRRRAPYIDAFGDEIPAGARQRIAVLTTIGAGDFIDYNVGSGIPYQYTVTWMANTAGVVLESEEQAPVEGVVTWRISGYLHDLANSAYFTPVEVSSLDVMQDQEQQHHNVRGRRSGVTFVGERFEGEFVITFAGDYVTEHGTYRRLLQMLDRQYALGTLYCLRLPHSGEVVFGIMEPPSRTDSEGTTEPSMGFRERHYEETV